MEMKLNEFMDEVSSINSRLDKKADKCYAMMNEDCISNLEDSIQPANMLENMLQDYKELEEYRAIGTPYSIKRDLTTLAEVRDKYLNERDDWQEKYKALYDEKLNIQSKSVYFEELRNLLCDMMNNYDNYTTGLANADTGTARFFYINALCNIMNKIVEMERTICQKDARIKFLEEQLIHERARSKKLCSVLNEFEAYFSTPQELSDFIANASNKNAELKVAMEKLKQEAITMDMVEKAAYDVIRSIIKDNDSTRSTPWATRSDEALIALAASRMIERIKRYAKEY